MNYEQLVKRVKSNQLPTRKMGNIFVSEIPAEMPEERALEIISMAQIAIKYREAYENGEYIPDDLTDEIFDKIKENKDALDNFNGPVFNPSDFL